MAHEMILVVDDSLDTLELTRRNLELSHYQVLTASSVAEGLEILAANRIDLVITDYHMPFVSGIDLIKQVREKYRDTEIVMITGYASVEGAVEAVKAGAEEYLSKPFTDEELLSVVEKVLEKLRLRLSRRSGGTGDDLPDLAKYGIIGRSAALSALRIAIQKAAAADTPALIVGEHGTERSQVGRALHYQSKRAAGPFVRIDLAEFPDEYLDNQLFGLATGTGGEQPGLFQTLRGGTIFIDQIHRAAPALQIKLLRILQSGEIAVPGGTAHGGIDVRLIAASSADLLGLIRKGLFREDLFFRLDMAHVTVPALRERRDDIALIVEHLAGRTARELGMTAPVFTPAAMALLEKWHWPGNYFELSGLITRLVQQGDGATIGPELLPQYLSESPR